MTYADELFEKPTVADLGANGILRLRKFQEYAVSIENRKLRKLLRELIATIELHTDCMSGQIDAEALVPYIELAARMGIEELPT